MGLFGNLLARIVGTQTSQQVKPSPDVASPFSIRDRAKGSEALAAQERARQAKFLPVISSNVAGIKWTPGKAVMGQLDPANKAQPGPQGGAAVLGGIKSAAGGNTTAVPVAFAGPTREEADDATLGTLEVMFRKGQVYAYFDVPRLVYTQMSAAASKGRFVYRVLTPNYRYRRIR